MSALRWQKTFNSTNKPEEIRPRSYVCGYCNRDVDSDRGYYAYALDKDTVVANIYICHRCSGPTFFSSDGDQTPGSSFGGPVSHIPRSEVEALYGESRDCMRVSAYTAAAMCSRKLLMNVAVDQDAEENKSFAYYVNYLAEQGYLPPNGKEWADHIRDKGNEANHEIPNISQADAQELIEFSEMMLKFIYEYPARIAERAQISDSPSERTPLP